MMNGPRVDKSIGRDALRLWLDFWELTGSIRLDIQRTTEACGDPSKMIPPEVSTTKIPSVRAILIEGTLDYIADRAGELPDGHVKLEFIDPVRKADTIVAGTTAYEIDNVLEKDLGTFSVWLVQAHRTR